MSTFFYAQAGIQPCLVGSPKINLHIVQLDLTISSLRDSGVPPEIVQFDFYRTVTQEGLYIL